MNFAKFPYYTQVYMQSPLLPQAAPACGAVLQPRFTAGFCFLASKAGAHAKARHCFAKAGEWAYAEALTQALALAPAQE